MSGIKEEAVKRYSSRLIEDYDGDRYDEDEYGYDATARTAFVSGAVWQASRPITDERIVAWDTIARHPFFRECYATEDTLLNAMLAELSDVTARLQTAQAKLADVLKITPTWYRGMYGSPDDMISMTDLRRFLSRVEQTEGE